MNRDKLLLGILIPLAVLATVVLRSKDVVGAAGITLWTVGWPGAVLALLRNL